MAVIVREKKKGSGEWWVFINHKGKRRSKKVGDKRAANAVKREVEQRLAKGDMGKVIGKQGRNAQAIRTILGAAAGKLRKRYVLEILEA